MSTPKEALSVTSLVTLAMQQQLPGTAGYSFVAPRRCGPVLVATPVLALARLLWLLSDGDLLHGDT